MDIEGLDQVFEGLKNCFQTETIVGKPITVGEITLLTLVEVGLGVGSSNISSDRIRDGSLKAIGVGAKISPSSVLVIRDNLVYAIPLKDKGSLDKVVEMLPEVLGRIKHKEEHIDLEHKKPV